MPVTPIEHCAFARIALVLQGGGALGSYQAGVYQALHEAGLEPDWLAGVSIGAINATIIAGNRREDRLPRLREFWDRVTRRRALPVVSEGDDLRRLRSVQSALATLALGTPGFFRPNPINPWLAPRGAPEALAFYDTAPLRETLADLVDWSMLAEAGGHPRLAVGTVNILSGNFQYFDTARTALTPAHVMASGALPPGLPPVRIGGDWYWDGGLVSNTPLQHLLEDEMDDRNTLVFQVDLFPARGPLPRDMEEVLGREKDIRYSSRTRMNTDAYTRLRRWQLQLKRALERVPEAGLTEEDRAMRARLARLPRLAILQMVYQAKAYEGQAKDYEFGYDTMRDHWQSGYEDTQRTLERRQWLELPPEDPGIVTHDVHRDDAP
ncbi:patatin-like phospholipase family protein [Roseicella frigidaeris]|uniref:Patatin-like phospholipase family protein n=1 Tax=Roseicella frigidaeris TaxID=2230885 RepID=A0A327MDB5_9PROT|nr:patatin-like phospholipase family protein [Roseicella frigidaeris]RAI60657.1 patatin-like phospholipase family protein [Roseicella frigidaeris]